MLLYYPYRANAPLDLLLLNPVLVLSTVHFQSRFKLQVNLLKELLGFTRKEEFRSQKTDLEHQHAQGRFPTYLP